MGLGALLHLMTRRHLLTTPQRIMKNSFISGFVEIEAMQKRKSIFLQILFVTDFFFSQQVLHSAKKSCTRVKFDMFGNPFKLVRTKK